MQKSHSPKYWQAAGKEVGAREKVAKCLTKERTGTSAGGKKANGQFGWQERKESDHLIRLTEATVRFGVNRCNVLKYPMAKDGLNLRREKEQKVKY